MGGGGTPVTSTCGCPYVKDTLFGVYKGGGCTPVTSACGCPYDKAISQRGSRRVNPFSSSLQVIWSWGWDASSGNGNFFFYFFFLFRGGGGGRFYCEILFGLV